MRDHLLGCRQFIPEVDRPNEDSWNVPAKAKPFALGVPRRVKWAPAKIDKDAVDRKDFETNDKTPASMRADFPHEYDLHTMYGDAARRVYNEQRKDHLLGHFFKAPISVKVDPARPGSDLTAVGVLMLQEQAKRQLDAAFGSRTAVAHARSIEEDRATIVARILADKQTLRPGKRPLALDL